MASPLPLPAPRDDLCLDFANTRYWRGSDPATETLNAPEDLLDWLAAAAAADPGALGALRAEWSARPAGAARDFAEALAWREALYAVLAAATDGAAPSVADLDALNEALAAAPPRSRIAPAGAAFGWAPGPAEGLAAAMAPVLWSAGDLLAGPRLARVKRCANPGCRWVFLDDSKSGNRRWCSMSACGNRAKAHRHYARRRQA